MSDGRLKRYMARYPTISDLRTKAKTRMPHVAWEYLDSATGDERAMAQNTARMSEVLLIPRFMKGAFHPDLSTTLFGRTYNAPFGIAPVGGGGLMWPGVEHILARSAARYGIPYCLSTVATQTPETVGPLVGDMGWFQLYCPRVGEITSDLLLRAKDQGFTTLVVTADVPVGSRRERATRAGFGIPPRVTPYMVFDAMRKPRWTARTLRRGLPKCLTLAKYAGVNDMTGLSNFVRTRLGGNLSWDYLKELRDEWDGPLTLKGVLHPDDAEQAISIGVDGIHVSNHGARQFDGVPAAIDALPVVARQVNGRARILFDGGVRSGLDVIRALSLGAEMVLLGRAFIFGVAALGKYGGDHAIEILLAEMKTDMSQLGCASLKDIPAPTDIGTGPRT